jgi:transposase InsO family protein
LLGLSRTTQRYKRRHRPDDAALRKRLRKLAARHKRYGCRRIAALILREGWRVNKKRIHRLWKEEGLQRARKTKAKRAQGPSLGLPTKAGHPNHVWSYDFIEDRTERGGRLRMLVVMDEFTRESLHIRVDRSASAAKVITTLEWLFLLHGRPQFIRSDNGPEFIAKELRLWLEKQGSATLYITPGSPWENAYIESFNDKFRDECLNMHVFTDGRHAREVVENWRNEYNEFRPHSSLDYMTPAEFASHWHNSGRPTASLRCANAGTTGQNPKPENPLTLVGT